MLPLRNLVILPLSACFAKNENGKKKFKMCDLQMRNKLSIKCLNVIKPMCDGVIILQVMIYTKEDER